MLTKKLLLIPLGGMGEVTQNMFLYEYDQEILIVDCGIGFPDQYTPGADIIIPDISYLLAELAAGKKIVGMVLSHGHDDHIAALPYVLPELPNFRIVASPLTAGFARQRIKEAAASREIEALVDGRPEKFGQHFQVTSLAVTHSVPDTKHLLIQTPVGLIYHGTDFKLDEHPVDGQVTDLEAIKQAGEAGIRLMLLDCLRVERSTWSKSESTVGPALLKELRTTTGKFIVTLMSSHIHRIQQVVDAAAAADRKVVFVGRSVEQNVKVAVDLGRLHLPEGIEINKKKIGQYRDEELVIVIAGSQGQEGSSLVRAVYGEHPVIQIKNQDKVVFSADAIPGNEIPYFRAIDELSRNKIEVVYPDIAADIHHTGHASAAEQAEILKLGHPSLIMPIGGSDRHRELFRKRVAAPQGYRDNQVLIPRTGEIIGLTETDWAVDQHIELAPRIVDGLGIGDVGPVVISDRRALAEAGMVVVVIPRQAGQFKFDQLEIVSRGFVFMKKADEVVDYIKQQTTEIITAAVKTVKSDFDLRKKIEIGLAKKLYQVIQRQPIIISVIVDQK